MKNLEIFLVESNEDIKNYLKMDFDKQNLALKIFSSSELMLIHLMRHPTKLNAHRCVILNEHQNGINGIETQIQIRKLEPNLPVIIYSYKPTVQSVIQAWRNGATSFFSSPFLVNEIISLAIKSIEKSTSTTQPFDEPTSEALRIAYKKLTLREREVLLLISKGNKNHEIGEHLGISIPTVKMHRSNLMKKLEMASIAQLVNFYHRCTRFLQI